MDLEAVFMNADARTRAAIGNALHCIAAKLLADVDRQDELNAALDRRRAVNARYRQIAPLVTRLVLFGREPADAAAAAARRLGLDPVRLEAWWKSLEGRRAVCALRDKRVMRHAAAGRRDAEIAALFGVSEGHVNRIVRRIVRSGTWRRGTTIGGAL